MEVKTPQMRCIEFEQGKRLEEIITEAMAAGMTWEELANTLSVSRFTLRDWTRKLGLKFVTKTMRVPETAGVE